MRLEPEVKEAAEAAAEDDRRTLSAYVEKLLVEHLRKAGYLKTAKKRRADKFVDKLRRRQNPQ